MKTVLHVGCGTTPITYYTDSFPTHQWRELRLDIDPMTEADIIADIRDMAAVASGSVDAVFSANNLEHVHFCEVPGVVAEFARVLRDDGFAIVTVPDLLTIARFVTEDRLTETIYEAPIGKVRPIDMLFGFQDWIANGKEFMHHKCGFTTKVLSQLLPDNGFARSVVFGRPAHIDIWAVATKTPMDDATLEGLARAYLPFLA